MISIETVVEQLNELEGVLQQHAKQAEGIRYQKNSKAEPLGLAIRKLRALQHVLTAQVLERPDVSRQTFSQTDETQPGGHPGFVERHESYGVISVNRVSGAIRLVGSMMENNYSFIELRVNQARRVVDEHMHSEAYYEDGRAPLLSVRMSIHQWANLLTSLNTTPQPCTLVTALGVSMDPVPDEALTPLGQIVKNARRNLGTPESNEASFKEALDAVKAKVQALGLSAKKTQEILEALSKVSNEVDVPREKAEWATRRLAAMTEETLAHARSEVAQMFQPAGSLNLPEVQANVKALLPKSEE